MKWPNTITIGRHAESSYNRLKAKKEADPQYLEFKKAFEERKVDPETARALARGLLERDDLVLGNGDHATGITELGKRQAEVTGARLKERIALPDVVLASPYDRVYQTLAGIAIGWPEFGEVKVVEDERLREQEHGLALLYSDWRIFRTLHPEQDALRDQEGPYWYRYPQGESVPDVRERNRSILGTMTRDYVGQNVFMMTHHLNILAMRANIERLGVSEFLELDENYKPVNCGITVYRGMPDLGQDGKLVLESYNEKLYDF